MGPTRPLAFLVAAALLAVTVPARAADYLELGPVVVPALDPGPVNATSTASTVTFEGPLAYAPAGAISASGFLGVTFGGPTTADAIVVTTVNAPVLAAGGLTARTGAITINAGAGDVTVGGLAVTAEGVSGQITATNLALAGTISVPVGSTLIAPFGVAATTTTGTVAVTLTGVPVAPLVVGSRIKVFAWTGVTHAITVSAVTGPALGPGLKYSAADVPVGGDVAVIAACGDLVADPGEQCDDGNLVPGDGCSATCILEPDAGADAGDAGDAGRDAGPDADAPDAAEVGDAAADGSADEGPLSGGPPLGDIFYDDGSSCAFAPAAAAGGFPVAALAILALIGRRRRQFR